MTITIRAFLPLVLILVVSACGADDTSDDHDDHDDHDHDDHEHENESEGDDAGLVMCCELGAFCHVIEDDPDPGVRDCHELGHTNDPAECRAGYDACMVVCADANDDPVEHACE